MTSKDPIGEAFALPNGARFYRCALQVNPFQYLKDQNKPTKYKDEDSYNTAMIDACRKNGIEVIAVMDHYRVRKLGCNYPTQEDQNDLGIDAEIGIASETI